jgi:Transmembrane secretion effector
MTGKPRNRALRARIRQLGADLTPLRSSRDFRLVFASRTVTLFGSQATSVALLVQARQLTGSAIAVGLLGVAELVPLVVFGLYGGALADRLDRRRLIRWCEAGLCCGRLGPGDHRARAGPGHRRGAGVPGPGRLGRHGQRDIPGHAVESDHPGRTAGPDGGRRTAQLRARSIRRPGKGGWGGQPHHARGLGLVWRADVHRRCRRHLRGAPRVRALPRGRGAAA